MSSAGAGRTRTAAMQAARTQDSHDKRARVLAAVQALENAGTPVTAAAVAAAARVSSWLVYAPGVREHIQAARRRQAAHSGAPSPAPSPASRAPTTPASLRTDLAVAREEIKRLRAERDKLRGRLRLHLGAEVDGPDRTELIKRIADQETGARRLVAERDARAAEAATATRRVHELEDELIAVRESLRQVIRDKNR
jgi:hypothetical protein